MKLDAKPNYVNLRLIFLEKFFTINIDCIDIDFLQNSLLSGINKQICFYC